MADFPTPLPPIKQFKLVLKFSLTFFKNFAPEISIDSILSTIFSGFSYNLIRKEGS